MKSLKIMIIVLFSKLWTLIICTDVKILLPIILSIGKVSIVSEDRDGKSDSFGAIEP